MALQLTLSCDSDKTESGPVLIHSTGVEHYKIPPDVIRILQETLTNELLSDHADGVLCNEGSQRVLDILLQNGFTLQNQSDEDGKTTWVVEKGGDGESDRSVQPPDSSNTTDADENGDDAGNEDQGGGEEGGEEDGEEGGEEKEEE
ncbi:unnamed protein product [Adineta ricciae]|uniref:Uncharacterized protein n=1 Tax=Adineta ricciae TaxID=249248 RepID=A0A814B6X1_ADIRI|nr:unnamed protein product [Adineta ricciae]